jgi:hypothetical protein
MLEVGYEAVVDDPEAQTRRMLDFCGLPWSERCLKDPNNTEAVRTASAVQVHQPLYRSSLDRWRHIQAWLEPLLTELASH